MPGGRSESPVLVHWGSEEAPDELSLLLRGRSVQALLRSAKMAISTRLSPVRLDVGSLGVYADWKPQPNTKGKRNDMTKHRYVLAGSLGVIGALLMSGTASAAVTGFTYGATISPPKQSAKTFGPAAITSTLDTFFTGGFTPTPTTTVVQFSKDIKFTPGNLAQCDLSSISTKPDSTAMSLCGKSKVGVGSVVVNDGALTGKVTAYNGIPSGGGVPPIGFHTDLFSHPAPIRSARPGSAPSTPRPTP